MDPGVPPGGAMGAESEQPPGGEGEQAGGKGGTALWAARGRKQRAPSLLPTFD